MPGAKTPKKRETSRIHSSFHRKISKSIRSIAIRLSQIARACKRLHSRCRLCRCKIHIHRAESNLLPLRIAIHHLCPCFKHSFVALGMLHPAREEPACRCSWCRSAGRIHFCERFLLTPKSYRRAAPFSLRFFASELAVKLLPYLLESMQLGSLP